MGNIKIRCLKTKNKCTDFTIGNVYQSGPVTWKTDKIGGYMVVSNNRNKKTASAFEFSRGKDLIFAGCLFRLLAGTHE